MSFTVIIPARLASTRLPGKPLADIHGLPMIVHVARRAALSQASQVVVATDADEVRAACAQHGVRTVMTRADHASGSDRLAEACELLGLDGQDLRQVASPHRRHRQRQGLGRAELRRAHAPSRTDQLISASGLRR